MERVQLRARLHWNAPDRRHIVLTRSVRPNALRTRNVRRTIHSVYRVGHVRQRAVPRHNACRVRSVRMAHVNPVHRPVTVTRGSYVYHRARVSVKRIKASLSPTTPRIQTYLQLHHPPQMHLQLHHLRHRHLVPRQQVQVPRRLPPRRRMRYPSKVGMLV